jgi:ubiquinone/menaquinone biosynthesis C-methylase UbiE/predicted transcriptional regulator
MQPDRNIKTVQDLQQLARQFQSCRVMLTACELGVFTVLSHEPMTAGQLADELKTDPRATDRLLNALVAIDLLEKSGEQFSNTDLTGRYLDRNSPEHLGDIDHAIQMWNTWSLLTEAVRKGTAPEHEPMGKRGAEWTRGFIAAMHASGSQRADDVVNLLDLSGVERVLDIGGGSGAYAMAFARKKPELTATVFDLPAVTPLTREYVKKEGFSDKVNTVDGDYNTDEFPKGYDLILLSSIVHIQSDEENRALIQKSVRALNPGGRVVVKDFLVEEDRTRPTFAALFALNMLVATKSGDTYRESEVRSWLEDAGLGQIERKDTSFNSSLVIGRLS